MTLDPANRRGAMNDESSHPTEQVRHAQVLVRPRRHTADVRTRPRDRVSDHRRRGEPDHRQADQERDDRETGPVEGGAQAARQDGRGRCGRCARRPGGAGAPGGTRGARGPAGDNGAPGARGTGGTDGSNATINGVAAGGDLAGAFPNPTIKPGALTTAAFDTAAVAPDSAKLGGVAASPHLTGGGKITNAAGHNTLYTVPLGTVGVANTGTTPHCSWLLHRTDQDSGPASVWIQNDGDAPRFRAWDDAGAIQSALSDVTHVTVQLVGADEVATIDIWVAWTNPGCRSSVRTTSST